MVRLRDSWPFSLSSAPTVGNPCRPLQPESVSVQWFAHESEPGALERFFARIREDRRRWEASPGRSRDKLNRETGWYEWHSKERRWNLDESEPHYFRQPQSWGAEDTASDPLA